MVERIFFFEETRGGAVGRFQNDFKSSLSTTYKNGRVLGHLNRQRITWHVK
jgi:hypothetical protein